MSMNKRYQGCSEMRPNEWQHLSVRSLMLAQAVKLRMHVFVEGITCISSVLGGTREAVELLSINYKPVPA